MSTSKASKGAEKHLWQLVKEPGNNVCADCKRPAPQWASHNLGIFLCVTCASVHRKIGTHVSKVKSMSMDSWTKEQVETMKLIGNTKNNQLYNPDERKHPPPADIDNAERGSELENFIRSKYERKAFMAKPSLLRPASVDTAAPVTPFPPPRAKSTPLTQPVTKATTPVPPVPKFMTPAQSSSALPSTSLLPSAALQPQAIPPSSFRMPLPAPAPHMAFGSRIPSAPPAMNSPPISRPVDLANPVWQDMMSISPMASPQSIMTSSPFQPYNTQNMTGFVPQTQSPMGSTSSPFNSFGVTNVGNALASPAPMNTNPYGNLSPLGTPALPSSFQQQAPLSSSLSSSPFQNMRSASMPVGFGSTGLSGHASPMQVPTYTGFGMGMGGSPMNLTPSPSMGSVALGNPFFQSGASTTAFQQQQQPQPQLQQPFMTGYSPNSFGGSLSQTTGYGTGGGMGHYQTPQQGVGAFGSPFQTQQQNPVQPFGAVPDNSKNPFMNGWTGSR